MSTIDWEYLEILLTWWLLIKNSSILLRHQVLRYENEIGKANGNFWDLKQCFLSALKRFINYHHKEQTDRFHFLTKDELGLWYSYYIHITCLSFKTTTAKFIRCPESVKSADSNDNFQLIHLKKVPREWLLINWIFQSSLIQLWKTLADILFRGQWTQIIL